MNSPKPTDSEQLDANLRRIIGIARYSEKGGIAEDTAVNEIKHLIAQRDQQRLSAALDSLWRELVYIGYGTDRIEMAFDSCRAEFVTTALGPDNSKTKE